MPYRKKTALFLTPLLLISAFFSWKYAFAQQESSTADKIISATFKGLAKGFVFMADIESLKKTNIGGLDKMSPEKFRKQYVKVYAVIKDLPLDIKTRYKIREQMTKEEIIAHIRSLDKQQMYFIIDSVPDKVIAEQFRVYLSRTKQKIQSSRLAEQISGLWNKIIERADKTGD